MSPVRTLIMGAAGRDFHNFNVFFRDNPDYEVVAFTATQIPDIEGRTYPSQLAGKMYPQGIPIHAESDLLELIKQFNVEQVIFAYSDVPHEVVMHKASMVLAAGADFRLMGEKLTQVKSTKPVVSVCAVRTGSGSNSATVTVRSRWLPRRQTCSTALLPGCPGGAYTVMSCLPYTDRRPAAGVRGGR